MLFMTLLLLMWEVSASPTYDLYQVQEDYIPILGYHAISNDGTITIQEFTNQMDYMRILILIF